MKFSTGRKASHVDRAAASLRYPIIKGEYCHPELERRERGGKEVKILTIIKIKTICYLRHARRVCSSYICYVVALIACTRSTFGNGCILSSFFSLRNGILTSNKVQYVYVVLFL
jgi:hypothetical protein